MGKRLLLSLVPLALTLYRPAICSPTPQFGHISIAEANHYRPTAEHHVRASSADSWEFHVLDWQASYRAPGHLHNMTITFTAEDMLVGGDPSNYQTNCSTTFVPGQRDAKGALIGQPTRAKPAHCESPDWIWYFRKYESPGEFAINLDHMSVKESVGPYRSIYFGTGRPVNWTATDPGIVEYCTASRFCDYWLNSTMVIPISAAT